MDRAVYQTDHKSGVWFFSFSKCKINVMRSLKYKHFTAAKDIKVVHHLSAGTTNPGRDATSIKVRVRGRKLHALELLLASGQFQPMA